LLAARHDEATLTHARTVIVVPARATEARKPFTLDKRHLRVRVRIDEDVAVIERGDEPDLARAQHAVAEDVATHVTDADGTERLRLRVAAHLAEMATHAFPCAARGDADFLVA